LFNQKGYFMSAIDKVTKHVFEPISFLLLTYCLLGSVPAEAVTYPVAGVWAAPSPDFPISGDEACFTIKSVGVNAIARRSVGQIMIFDGNKRYSVNANAQTSYAFHSLKAVDNGYWITELSTERRRFWFKTKITYFLTIVDSMVLEIRENSRRTRFVKCGPRGKLHI
jgi:hypothetical protein